MVVVVVVVVVVAVVIVVAAAVVVVAAVVPVVVVVVAEVVAVVAAAAVVVVVVVVVLTLMKAGRCANSSAHLRSDSTKPKQRLHAWPRASIDTVWYSFGSPFSIAMKYDMRMYCFTVINNKGCREKTPHDGK